jgi:hypothetical protein
MPLAAYYDSVPMRALALAQNDAARERLPQEKQLLIRDTIAEIVDDLDDHADDAPEPADGGPAPATTPVLTTSDLRPDWLVEHPVLCLASRSPLDEAAATMLGQLLAKHGIAAKVQPFADVASAKSLKVDAADAPLVCLSYFGAVRNPAHVRFLIRRLKRLMPNAKFMAGFWTLGDDPGKGEEWRTAVGAQFVATSLREALAICVREAAQPDPGAIKSDNPSSTAAEPVADALGAVR